ncbi:3799_t:CDS:1 [Diversispora eburnea]|uniref:3799_t:CDS:1 n=1 Tax=Diversispora eburnea TaxID=1213867 RepID=A0A9N8VPZ6_9GLOM|nr:3799_t:CDS:1 [Diversispora eburnea]
MQFFKFLQTLALIAILYVVIAASQPLDTPAYNKRHEVKRHNHLSFNKRHHNPDHPVKRHHHPDHPVKRHHHKRQEKCTNDDPSNESDNFAVKSCNLSDGTPYIEPVKS